MKQLQKELDEAIRFLNHDKVSWIDKHFILSLKEQALILLSSLLRFEDEDEVAEIKQAVRSFLVEVKPVIEKINKG